MSTIAAPELTMAPPPPMPPVVDMADPAPYDRDRRIVAAEARERSVAVRWDDGADADIPMLWLRSECACPECRDRETLERTFDHLCLPLDLDATTVEVAEGGALHLVWPDGGHESWFDPGWLWTRAAAPERGSATRAPWGAELATTLPVFEHAAVVTDDRAFHSWLVALRDVGLTLLRGVPREVGEVERLARRIALPRDTNFGIVFDVTTKPQPNSNAYTAIELAPHVDLAGREYLPGYQFFHCLENDASGGESLYVDGGALAAALRAVDPESFDLLSTTPIDYRFCDSESDYTWRAPVIDLDRAGEIREIRFNPWLMEPLAPDRFTAVYRALRRFDELSRDPRFQIRLRLDPGTMSGFDNRRILHGRAAFDPRTGRRHFQGCYVEHEEVASRIRVLERTL